MRVFVLSTGRCGSKTFATACGHLSNYSAAHESLRKLVGDDRLAYPDRHIEVDNRLTWYLGRLAKSFDGTDVLYVHLRRDPEAVARSYAARWEAPFRPSMIRAYAHGIVQMVPDWPETERLAVCRDYVDTVTANIEEFTSRRPSMTIDLETAAEQFSAFLARVGAEGDLDAATAEFKVLHNATI